MTIIRTGAGTTVPAPPFSAFGASVPNGNRGTVWCREFGGNIMAVDWYAAAVKAIAETAKVGNSGYRIAVAEDGTVGSQLLTEDADPWGLFMVRCGVWYDDPQRLADEMAEYYEPLNSDTEGGS